MKLILRVVGIAISLTLVVLVGIAIVTLRSEEPAQETVVVLSPTAIEDDYAAYVERLNRTVPKVATHTPDWQSDYSITHNDAVALIDGSNVLHEADVNSDSEPHHENRRFYDDPAYQSMKSEYDSILASASPEVAATMEEIRRRVENMSVDEALATDFNALLQEYLERDGY